MNSKDRRRYGELKRELARRDFAYMHEYNNAKAPLIHEIYARVFAALETTPNDASRAT